LRQIVEFPFSLFGERPGPFWTLVRESLETSVIVGLWRILFDTDGDALTLRQLKNQVRVHAVDDSARRAIADRLRERAVGTRIAEIEEKVTYLRHNHFAHLDAKAVTGQAPEPHQRVTFEELDGLAEAAHDLINSIGMRTYYMTLFPDYDPTVTRGGRHEPSDVETLLDDMVKRSDVIHLPETKPYEFPFFWKHRSTRERQQYNRYRRKFGLLEMPEDG